MTLMNLLKSFEVTVEATTQRTVVVEAIDFKEAHSLAEREVAHRIGAIATTVIDIQELYKNGQS